MNDIDRLTFVTSNEDKKEEAQQILDAEISKEDLEIKEIQEIDVSEVAREKARQAHKELERPVMVDDTGLFLDEWNGFPGALIKWILKSRGAEGACQLVSENKTATAKTAVGLCVDGETRVFTGEVKGRITEKPRGSDGFGWDPVFIPEEHDQTFAEMDSEAKNQISMRKKALHELKDHLDRRNE